MGLLDRLLGSGDSGGSNTQSVGGELLRLLASRAPPSAGGAPDAPSASPRQPGAVADGLGELVQKFEQGGLGDIAKSWISSAGQNRPVTPDQLHQALGQDTTNELADRTGLDPGELLSRLSKDLPEIIDRLTPTGQIPDKAEIAEMQSKTSDDA